MISPVNPGPAGSQGPAGLVLGPPGPGVIDGVLQSGTVVISQAIAQSTQAIQTLLNQALQTVRDAILKGATSVASKINNVQTVVQLASNQATTAAKLATTGIGVAQLPPPGGGQCSELGSPWQLVCVCSDVEKKYLGPTVEPFYAGYQNDTTGAYAIVGSASCYVDALALAQTTPCPPYTGACPTGIIKPPTLGLGGGPCTGYSCFQKNNPDGSATCICLCDGTPAPPGFTLISSGQRLDSLPGPPGTEFNCIPTPTDQPKFCAGCDANGMTVCWDARLPTPGGITGVICGLRSCDEAVTFTQCGKQIGTGGTPWFACCDKDGNTLTFQGSPPSTCASPVIGPFNTSDDARAAAKCSKVILPPVGVDCSQCPTGTLTPTSCQGIDFCDWQKFEDHMAEALYRGLCKFIKDPDCNCKLRDAERWEYEDCSNEFTDPAKAWLEDVGNVLGNAVSIGDVIRAAGRKVGAP